MRDYFRRLTGYLEALEVTDGEGAKVDFEEGLAGAARLAVERAAAGSKVLFIGNGGSAAIAGHMATDWCKNGGIRAMAFNDGSMLTCLGNDYGYRHVFEKPILLFAEAGDLLFAISSSGRSENILMGVKAAREKDCKVVTLSGFTPDNPLRAMGDINLYVPVGLYGPVEVLHHALCHGILDTVIRIKGGARCE